MSVRQRPEAREDVIAIAGYLGRSDPALSDRFLDALEGSLAILEGSPRMGRSFQTPDPRLSGLRLYRVGGFEKHLVFYLPTAQGVEVVRVIHGARDLPSLLAKPG